MPIDIESPYGVWCEVWGGITGHRAAWAKRIDGSREEYATKDEAEARARELIQRIGTGFGRARFSYEARTITAY